MASKRSGMHTSTAYNHFARLRSRAADLFSQHIHFQSTHATILADLTTTIYQDRAFGRLSGYYQGYLRGLIDAHWAHVEALTDWQMGPEDRSWIRTAGDPWDDRIAELCRQPGKLFAAHFWRGSDRLYGEWKCSNLEMTEHEVPPCEP